MIYKFNSVRHGIIDVHVLFPRQGGSCPNCQDMTTKLEKFSVSIKDKDLTIKELKSLCTKFEKQLTQQDHLLKQWAESKGQKVNYNPK